MANIKSSMKRAELSKVQNLRNKSRKSEIKTYVKKFEQALEAGDLDKAEEYFRYVNKRMNQAASKNTIHKNKASRFTSNMQKKLNAAKVA